jgi:hypothetical protein
VKASWLHDMLRIHNRRHEAAAKSAWTIEGGVQVEESGERGSAPGARRGMAR